MHLALVFVVSLLAQDPDEIAEGLAKAKTIEKCQAIYAPAKKTFPTAYIRGTSVDAAACTRRVMNVELDKVLVPLKKSDADAFKKAMATQKLFNEAVKRYCGRWEKYYAACCSTCSFTEQPECEMDFHAGRLALLAGSTGATAAPNARLRTEFGEFAKSLCDGECAERALGVLQTKQHDSGAELSCK